LSLNETNRRCRVTLRTEAAAGAYAIAMPAGCRRALPILSDVLGWSAATNELRLTGGGGNPVLQFTAADDPARLAAKGPEGEIYTLAAATSGPHLVAVDSNMMAQATPAATAPAGQAAQAAPGPQDVPGRYDILRAAGKDTNCQL